MITTLNNEIVRLLPGCSNPTLKEIRDEVIKILNSCGWTVDVCGEDQFIIRKKDTDGKIETKGHDCHSLLRFALQLSGR